MYICIYIYILYTYTYTTHIYIYIYREREICSDAGSSAGGRHRIRRGRKRNTTTCVFRDVTCLSVLLDTFYLKVSQRKHGVEATCWLLLNMFYSKVVKPTKLESSTRLETSIASKVLSNVLLETRKLLNQSTKTWCRSAGRGLGGAPLDFRAAPPRLRALFITLLISNTSHIITLYNI